MPQDAKTVDIGVNGDRTSQTLILTAVVPIQDINGWIGIFGSRAASEGEVLSEIAKARAQGGFRIGTVGIEAFTDLERNISKGSTVNGTHNLKVGACASSQLRLLLKHPPS